MFLYQTVDWHVGVYSVQVAVCSVQSTEPSLHSTASPTVSRSAGRMLTETLLLLLALFLVVYWYATKGRSF